MLGGIDPFVLIASLMVASVPIMLAAIGELVVERAGVLNLGVEGMMIVGAVCGFIAAVETGSPLAGFAGGMAGAVSLSLIFAFLTQVLLANQVACGLALTLFGLGLAALLGQGYVGIKPPATGAIVWGLDWLVPASIAIIAAVWWFLRATRAGLTVRAVGESADAAHALGYKVVRIRVMAIMFGGAMAGLGGAYISLVRVPQWTDGITAGAGWIALAIVVFASWRPWRVLVGAYLFGGITVLQLNLQAAGVPIPVEYLSMSPYLITIAVLVIMSRGRGSLAAPAALGQTFHASR
jgi:general nucleoside transport system permease protein